MYRKRRVRSPTPPPLIITFQDEEDDRHSWYWEEHGGGMRLYFGKYKGKKIHDVPLSYLLWCYETFDERPQNVSFLTAFEYYYEGLKSLTEDDYDRFIVPFGKKHRGKTICQCRDKEWMVWTLRQRQLVQKHPIYFDAVRQWLAHPRKQEVHRDIGENLLATEYADDLDLEEDEDEGPDLHGYLRDQPLVEDLDFIDDSSQPASVSDHDLDDEDNDTSPSGAAAVSRTASESDRDVGVNDQSTIQDDDDDTQDTGSASDADIVDDADDAARQTPIRNFIVDSTSTDGDESYANSESHSDDVDKVQARVTRSQMKRKAMKKQRNTESSPLTSRSRGRKVIFSVTLSDSSDEDHPRSVLASKKTRNPLADTSSDIDEPGVTEPPPDPSSSPVSRRRGRMVIMSDTSSNNDPDEPIHGKCPFQNGRYSPLSRRNL
ncbi:hypothetical protein K439DRAFT_985200 [Ramaria rubella]|nr:hypothetical protein K439DRAFT_985200 [Ramaria rubella]